MCIRVIIIRFCCTAARPMTVSATCTEQLSSNMTARSRTGIAPRPIKTLGNEPADVETPWPASADTCVPLFEEATGGLNLGIKERC